MTDTKPEVTEDFDIYATPRVNALDFGDQRNRMIYSDLWDLARKLEVELNFATVALEYSNEEVKRLIEENDQLQRDLEAARRERDEARSLHARLANSTGYLVDRIKRLEALVREMAREGGQAPTAEKEIARIAAETRTPQTGERDAAYQALRSIRLSHPTPQAGEEHVHVPTDMCGFDRHSSLSENRYVCDCGWREPQ